MKYAILGPKKAVLRISETEPQSLSENVSFQEVTNKIAELVIAGQKPETRQLYFLIDGVLKTQKEYIESIRPKIPRKQTKLQIMLILQEMNKWTTFKTILSTLPEIVQDAWELSQYIDESDPLFSSNKTALLTALNITEEQLSSLFDK
jgi:hypothetical protein